MQTKKLSMCDICYFLQAAYSNEGHSFKSCTAHCCKFGVPAEYNKLNKPQNGRNSNLSVRNVIRKDFLGGLLRNYKKAAQFLTVYFMLRLL
jgi:hypothetical protein